jgi:DNA-binding HxlR family transcriptional regulator
MRLKKTREEIHLCPAIAFGQIVGGKYKLRILWSLRERALRYGEIRAGLLKGSLGKAITPRILSRELKELQGRGLIARRQFNEVPPRVEYSLTETGQTLLPIIDEIVDWGLTGIHEEILGISAQTISATL